MDKKSFHPNGVKIKLETNSSGFEDNQQMKNIKEVFKLNSELENIGTKEQYEQYLTTVFPQSKMQDIVWHGSLSKEPFDNFNLDKESTHGFEKHGGIFFTSMIEDAKTRGSGKLEEHARCIIPAVVNIQNPVVTGEKEVAKTVDNTVAYGKDETQELLGNEMILKRWEELGWGYRIENENLIVTKPVTEKQVGLFSLDGNLVVDLSQNVMYIGNLSEWQTKPLLNMGFDSVIDTDASNAGFEVDLGVNDVGRIMKHKSWYIILNPKDVHILGSQSDIEGFKNFIESKSDHFKITLEQLHNLEEVSLSDKINILLTYRGLKPVSSMYWPIEEKDFNTNPTFQSEIKERIESIKSVLHNLGLEYDFDEYKDDGFIYPGFDFSRSRELLNELSLEKTDDIKRAELYGYPTTAAEAYQKGMEFVMRDVPQEIKEGLPENLKKAANFPRNFFFSKDHYKEELETLHTWSEAIKEIDPELYNQIKNK